MTTAHNPSGSPPLIPHPLQLPPPMFRQGRHQVMARDAVAEVRAATLIAFSNQIHGSQRHGDQIGIHTASGVSPPRGSEIQATFPCWFVGAMVEARDQTDLQDKIPTQIGCRQPRRAPGADGLKNTKGQCEPIRS